MAGSGSAAVAAAATPVAPVHAGETAKVSRERPPGLPLIRRNTALRLGDLSLQVGDGLRGLPAPGSNLAFGEPAGFQSLQRLAIFPELNPMPRNPMSALMIQLPDSPPSYHCMRT